MAVSETKKVISKQDGSAAFKLLRVVALGYALTLILAIAFEDWFIYQPRALAVESSDVTRIELEDVFLTTPDHVQLHGWYVHNPQAIGSLLFLHGNDGNVGDWLAQIYHLHRVTGVNVLAIDYRGFGASTGRPSESGLVTDARTARRWLAERNSIPEEEVILLGRSLGGAVAVQLAAELNPRALILERTFTSLPAAASARFPFLPTKWLMRNRFPSVELIPHVQSPLLQSHGDADYVVPLDQGRELFARAGSSRKQFIVIDDAGHNSPQPPDYYQRVRQFLKSLPAE